MGLYVESDVIGDPRNCFSHTLPGGDYVLLQILLFSQAQRKNNVPILNKEAIWMEGVRREVALALHGVLEPTALRLVRGALSFHLPRTHPHFFFQISKADIFHFLFQEMKF